MKEPVHGALHVTCHGLSGSTGPRQAQCSQLKNGLFGLLNTVISLKFLQSSRQSGSHIFFLSMVGGNRTLWRERTCTHLRFLDDSPWDLGASLIFSGAQISQLCNE